MTEIHTRILRLALGIEESRAYWQHVDLAVPATSRALGAFEQRWFGNKSMQRVRFLLANLAERFDPLPESLAALSRWPAMDSATRQVLCHFHLQISDPIYRRFTGAYLVERRGLRNPVVDRDAVLRWVKNEFPDRWSETTCVQFASKLLSAASEAGLVSAKRDPRTLLLPKVSDAALKRLLKKKSAQEPVLRELFQKHRGDLKLYGYNCEEITEEDFIEVYPMLPGHVDLLMQITSNLRTRSTRVQGDDHAIRGLLQLLGELFREQKLADLEVGALVTLDSIFEVQHSALDADVQTTLARVLAEPHVRDDELAQRVAKAVALLELIQEQTPTTAVLVAQCIYARLGEGNRVQAVTDALERLRGANLLSYSEKHGYKVQSSAGQEWQRERDDIGVTQEKISESVQNAIKALVGLMHERPRYKGRAFPWTLWFSDGRQAHDVKLQEVREDSAIPVDFRLLGKKDDRSAATWVQRSSQEQLCNRLVWVVGETGAIEDNARQLVRSEKLIERHRPRRESLLREKQRLLLEEETRSEALEARLRASVQEAFLDGTVYFRGQQFRPREAGAAFGTALGALATRIVPDLYPHFTEFAVTPAELTQLLDKELSGPSKKFMDEGLGILTLDVGKYVATCSGLLLDTTADAISPTLVEVRDRFASRIRQAEDASNDLLDEELAKAADKPVVKVETHLRGREVGSREQLQNVFKELEDRIGPLLDKGNRVRIV